MKIKKAFLFLASGFWLPFILASCQDEPVVKPRTELPPLTCEAKETFGCLLNGEIYLPDGLNAFDVQYDFRNNPYKGDFRLAAKRDSKREAIRITLYNQVFDTGHYKLGFDDIYVGNVRYSYITDHINDYWCFGHMYGELNVSGIDTVKRIICGTFSFDAVNKENDQDTVRIRNARFDATFYY